ncbi:hypothetical protein ABZV93_22060 [Actinopolymorpha sp. NPDC004070]|uniref:hypothetical protein n=1 Tax=Actinopolymorpha sp. NPDC004070 TaxID=3154548 RepID=UPI0033AAC73B
MADSSLAVRGTVISAGDISVTVRSALRRLRADNDGDRQKAVHAGLDELVSREALTRDEAKELSAIFDLFFASPDGTDPKLVRRVQAFYQGLVLDQGSSPAAVAVASVLNSLVSKRPADGDQPAPRSLKAGDAVFGGTGALVGAGIGFGFGGPIGAGIGAAVGGAIGVCIED